MIGSTTVSAVVTSELMPGDWALRVDDSPVVPGSETTMTIELSSGQVLTVAIEFKP